MALSPEQMDEKRDFERLFGESGWHRLEKEWEHRAKTIRSQALDAVRGETDLWYQRGIVAVLEELLRLRDQKLAEYEEPKEIPWSDATPYE